MYQVIPLLLAFAMLMPWTDPADPGNRIAAANAADGLAEQALIYHQAAVAFVLANPGASGVVPPSSLPSAWSTTEIASCVKSQIVATYVTVPTTVSAAAVAGAMGRLWGTYPIVGQAASQSMTNAYTGTALALPCSIPDQAPTIVSEAGG